MASISHLNNPESVHLLSPKSNAFEENDQSSTNGRHVQADSLEVIETGKALKVHTDKPHLVSLGGGRLSTAVTIFPLPEGRTNVGTEDAVFPQDVVIQGTGVESQHCFIENVNNTVTLHPLAEKTAIDGLRVTKPTRLTQGSMICLGRSTYFRFNHPQEAQLMKSILPNTRISVVPINFNAEFNGANNSTLPSTITNSLPSGNSTPTASLVQSDMQTTTSRYTPKKNDVSNEDFMEIVSKFEYLSHNRSNAVTSDTQRWFTRDGIRLTPNPPSSTFVAQNANSLRNKEPEKKLTLHPISNPLVNKSSSSVMAPKLVSLTKLDPQISPKVFLPTASAQDAVKTNRTLTPSSQNDLKSRSNLDDLQVYEQQHQKVVEERIREQELEKQEQMRLEEILNICAEYERQSQREKNTNDKETHIEKSLKSTEVNASKDKEMDNRTSPTPSPTYFAGGHHINRIKTNGSLPRDRAKSPAQDVNCVYHRKPIKSTSSEDELTRIFNFESSPTTPGSPPDYSGSNNGTKHIAPYSTYPQSPRTRIKTVVNKEKVVTHEIYENRAALENNGVTSDMNINERSIPNTSQPSARIIANKAAIDVADEVFFPEQRIRKQSSNFKMSTALIQEEAAILRQQKNAVIRQITAIRHQTLDLDSQDDDVVSELEMECALLEGELRALLEKNRCDEELLARLKQKESDLICENELAREKELREIDSARIRLEEMEKVLKNLECNLDGQPEGSPEREELLRQIKHQHEVVETERKLFEDLEFHQFEHHAHREEEREQIVREWMVLQEQIKKRQVEIREIEIQKEETSNQIKQEKQALLAERQRLAASLKIERDKLATIDTKLKALIALDMSTDQDSDEESPQSSDEGEMLLEAKAPVVLERERKLLTTPTDRQKRGGFIFEEEIISVGNTNSFSSFDSGTSSGTSSDIPSGSASSEEYADKEMIVKDSAHLSSAWLQMKQKAAEREALLEETTPLCSASQEDDVRHRENFIFHQQRPLTRYLPIRSDDFNLKQHVESAGHQIELCSHVHISRTSCRGFLYKLGTKFRTWNKRWFVFDRTKHMLMYYADKAELRPRGCILFQRILEVYVDHLHSVRSPNPKLTFCVKTLDRPFYLVAPSAETMRIWVDVIFTGAEGYQEFQGGC